MYYLMKETLEIIFSETEIEGAMLSGTLESMQESQALWQGQREYNARPKAVKVEGVKIDILAGSDEEKRNAWEANYAQWDTEKKAFIHQIRLSRSGYPVTFGSLTTFVFMNDGVTIIFHANFNGRIVSESHWSGGTCRKVILVETSGNSEITSQERIYDMTVYPALYELYLAAQAKRPIKKRLIS